MRRIATALIGLALATLTACSAETTGTTTVTATATVSATAADHATARTMTDDHASALACKTYADAENRITDTWDAMVSWQHSGGTDSTQAGKYLFAYQDARSDWLMRIGEALAVVPNNSIYAAMAQAPAFYRYWTGTGTQAEGAAVYAYSLVLVDVDKACADAGHPMHLTPATEPGRTGLPADLQAG